jgi:hypothetical protein
MLGPPDGVDVAPHELLAPTALLDDEIGAFEHRHVLLHGGEAHVVGTSERRDRRVGLHRAPDDVTTSAVGERLEHPIDLIVVQLVADSIYNHLVVC